MFLTAADTDIVNALLTTHTSMHEDGRQLQAVSHGRADSDRPAHILPYKAEGMRSVTAEYIKSERTPGPNANHTATVHCGPIHIQFCGFSFD